MRNIDGKACDGWHDQASVVLLRPLHNTVPKDSPADVVSYLVVMGERASKHSHWANLVRDGDIWGISMM